MRITATEARRKFGEVMWVAQREPVEILSHGNRVAVLISAAEYARLKARERRMALAGEFDAETVRLIEAAEAPAEASRFDDELD